jgi:enoyl-CoA hydratase/carnithine racemase
MTDVHVVIDGSTEDPVRVIRLHRPDKRNALTAGMYAALAEAFRQLDADTTTRAIVLTGGEAAFTGGNDLADFLHQPPGGPEAPVFRFMHALSACRKPVVAAVCGPAVGIGTTLLLHCDFVYVATDARLSTPFVKLGLVPEYASSLLMPARLGHVRAAEWLLLGETFTGEQAASLGLANRALATTEVLPAALATARQLAALPPTAVQASKALMRRPAAEALRSTMELETAAFGQALQSAEAKAAFAAFLRR